MQGKKEGGGGGILLLLPRIFIMMFQKYHTATKKVNSLFEDRRHKIMVHSQI